MTLLCKGTYVAVAPFHKAGANVPVMHPRSGVHGIQSLYI